MGTRDIKVHFNRAWQALTDVDVWSYKYEYLMKDIMKLFHLFGVPEPKFKIECQMGLAYVPIYDTESLRRCMLLGEMELNMFVEVIQPMHEYDCQDKQTTELGYYVEEVEDEDEVVVLDSEEDLDKDHALDSEQNTSEGERCTISTDGEVDEDYEVVDEGHSDGAESLEEDEDDIMNDANDDELSEVGSDGEGMIHNVEDIEADRELEQINRACAGVWFRRQDDGYIKLQKGHLFNNVKHFREVLREYIIQEGFDVIRLKNEKSRVTVACKAEGCTWRVHATPTAVGDTFKIKTYTEEHNCLRKSKFGDATYTWIAAKMYDKFAAEPNKCRQGIEQDLKDMFGITGLSNMKLFRAKQKAKILIHGDHKEQYAKLRVYGELVLDKNPGSIFNIRPCPRQYVDAPLIFQRCFVMFSGVKNGFLDGCRPFIGVDGCFLKGPYGGMFLSAVALDGNNGVVPLAGCVAEAENRDSWMYFFGMLREAIGDDYSGVPWTIMSDRQKGLVDAVQSVFPTAIQRFCMMHIEANFKLKFRGVELTKNLWGAGKATNLREFEKAMNALKDANVEAHGWLEKIPKHLWSRHAFNSVSKVDHISNNVAESLNSWINKHRDLPLLSFLEEYRLKVMRRMSSRYARAIQWKGKIVPHVTKKINAEWVYARRVEVFSAGHDEFQCKINSELRVINLNNWTCDCGKWEVSGIPCKHAIACIRMCNKEVEDYCHAAYYSEVYLKVYTNIIHPQPGLGDLQMPQGEIMQPPPLRRLPGRPRKARRMQPSESVNTQRNTVLRCSNCKSIGHNIRSCQKAPTRTSKENNVGDAGASSTSHRRQEPLRTKLGIRSKMKKPWK